MNYSFCLYKITRAPYPNIKIRLIEVKKSIISFLYNFEDTLGNNDEPVKIPAKRNGIANVACVKTVDVVNPLIACDVTINVEATIKKPVIEAFCLNLSQSFR